VGTPPKILFVDFEGIDGSGKTSLSNKIADLLREQGYSVHHVRDKGQFKSVVSKEIRSVTRDPHFLRMSDTAELLLYVARDAQMVEEYIKPRMKEGAVIFCDRYFYSSVTHSHFGRGLDRKAVEQVIEPAAQGIWPDFVVYCDVDSLTSRVRKRIQKIHDHRFGDFGRKGLMGIGFRERMREGFLTLAKEYGDDWQVIDNAHNTFEESLTQIYGAVSDALVKKGFARPKPLAIEPKPAERVSYAAPAERADREGLVAAFWKHLDRLAVAQPGLAGFYLIKMDTPEAYALRDKIVEREPEVVAYGLSGLDSPKSLEYRTRLLPVAPFFVARSLGCLKKSPEGMELRKRLVGREPGQVALSLRGVDTPEAWAFRRRLRDDAIREVIASLRGIDTEDAWRVRDQHGKKKYYEPVAESLGGIDTDRAWALREEMADRALPWVLMSLRGCWSPRAWEWRFKYVDRAPKIIVRTIGRQDTEEAWKIRDCVKPFVKEALDSVSGSDGERAWKLRFELADRWPNTAVSSLGAGNQSERAWRFRWEILRKHPENLLLVKHVAKAAVRAVEDEDEMDED
jgi:dTMP kinase